MKSWDLAKKSDFTPFLSSGTENENFFHTMMIYIENGTHGQILTFFVKFTWNGFSNSLTQLLLMITLTSYVRNSQKKQYLIFGEMRNIF